MDIKQGARVIDILPVTHGRCPRIGTVIESPDQERVVVHWNGNWTNSTRSADEVVPYTSAALDALED